MSEAAKMQRFDLEGKSSVADSPYGMFVIYSDHAVECDRRHQHYPPTRKLLPNGKPNPNYDPNFKPVRPPPPPPPAKWKAR